MKREILVVDDNFDIRFLICNILKKRLYCQFSSKLWSSSFWNSEKIPD